MRIAVVGAGVAGLTAAWLLDSAREHEITVFEAEDRLGGHVESVRVPTPHGPVTVDLGAQYVSPVGFPAYGRLLAALGVGAAELADAPVSLTMTAADGPLLVPPPRPEGPAGPGGPARASLNAFLAAAAEFASADGDWSVPLAELLDPLPLPEEHKRRVIRPLLAYISSCPDEQAPELSARAATAFFLALPPPAPGRAPVWANATHGLAAVTTRLAARLGAPHAHRTRLLTGCAVAAVRRVGAGFELTDRAGRAHPADRLVLAVPAHAAGPLLAPVAGCEEVRRALAAIPYTPVTVAVHRDGRYMPADRAHWSTVNLHSHDGWTEACNWYGPVLGPPGAGVFKSWITHREPPAEPVATRAFRHLVVTAGAVRAREVLARHQGAGGIHFAGSHLTYIDSQEAAVRSAVAVARALGVDSPPLRALTTPEGP
ncbi:FAD-dependent oxidoreductase [Kitasatospora sp. NPDC004531]